MEDGAASARGEALAGSRELVSSDEGTGDAMKFVA